MIKNKNKVALLSSAAIGTLIATALSTVAYAETDAILTKNSNENIVQYSYEDLKNAAEEAVMDGKSELLDKFISQMTVGVHDSLNGYINFQSIKDAAEMSEMDGINFNLDEFTEKQVTVDDKMQLPDEIKVVKVDKDGTIKEETKDVAQKAELKVQSVSAINETAIQVTGLAKEVKEADLAGKKITLKAGDVSLTATYVATSLTEDGKANFVLEAEKKLTDAVTYTVSADWASFTTNTFVAKGIVAPYVNKVEVLTKAVPANTAASNLNLVHFTAKNQYGEDIVLAGNVAHLAVKGTINGVPFVSTELQGETNLADGIVEINKDLKEGDKVTLTVTNTINGKADVEVGTVSYTVAKEETAVATTVSDMKAIYANAANPNGHNQNTEAKEVLPEDHVTLSATVKNQFGSPMNAAQVRWVVEEGKDVITQTNNNAIVEVSDAANFTFKAAKAGKVKISAYIGNGKKVTYEVTIGAQKLSDLTLDNTNAVNASNQDEAKTKVVTPNAGANLTADQIKFDVKAAKTTVDVTAADVQVTAKVRGGNAANKNDIVIVVKSTKPGKYTITPYVGESLAKATAKAANGFDVTTTIDQTVASIDNIAFDAAELKAGVEIKKDVTFRNKHKEVVVLEDANLPVDTTVSVLPTVANINRGQAGDAVAKVTKVDNKNVLTLKLNDAKLYNVVISKDEVIKAFNLTFAAPTFTKVDAGADVTGVVAGDPNTKAKDQAIKFLDQDGKEMPVKAEDLRVTVTKPDGQALGTVSHLVQLAANYGFSEAGADQFDLAENAEIVKGFRVQPNAALAQGVYTVKIANADGKIADTFTVTVGAARVAKTVEVTPVSTNVALNGQTKVKIVPKDQYGEFIANAAGVAIEVVQGDHFAKGNVTEVQNDAHATVAYEVTLTGTVKGINDVVVNVKNGETVLATNKVSMTVDAVANLVSSIEVDKSDIKPLYSTSAADPADIQLKAIAKDAAGTVIPVDNADLFWTIKSVTGKVGAAGAEADATVANVGAVGLHTGLYAPVQNFKGTVTIEVRTANMKVGEITLNLDNAPAAAKTGTTIVANNTADMVVDGDKTKEGIQVLLDGVGNKEGAADAEAHGAIVLKLSAKNQYGTAIDTVDFDENKVIAMAGDTSVVTPVVNHNDNTITLTAKGVGTSNVYVQYNGDTITLEVSVNKDAVDAAVAAIPMAVQLGNTTQTTPGVAAKGEVTAEAGEYTVTIGTADITIDGRAFTYKATTEASKWKDATELVTLISADATLKDKYTATVSGTNVKLVQKAGQESATAPVVTGTGASVATTKAGVAHKAAVNATPGVATTTVTAGANRAGDIKVRVNGGGVNNKDVVVALTADDDTAAEVAAKIVAALNADGTVNPVYTASQGTNANTADVILTQKTGAATQVTVAIQP